jgi:hypothetical protein
MLLLAIISLVLTIPLASYPPSTILLHRNTFLGLSLLIEFYSLGELFHQTIFCNSETLENMSMSISTLILEPYFISNPNLMSISVYTIFVPLMIYTEPEKDKADILKDLKNKAGIYQWTNKDSGKNYIGSSSNLSRRIQCYYRTTYLNRDNTRFCKAILLHNLSAFTLTIFEYIDISHLPKNEARKLIMQREQLYFNEIKPKYNTLKFTGTWIYLQKSKRSTNKGVGFS